MNDTNLNLDLDRTGLDLGFALVLSFVVLAQ